MVECCVFGVDVVVIFVEAIFTFSRQNVSRAIWLACVSRERIVDPHDTTQHDTTMEITPTPF